MKKILIGLLMLTSVMASASEYRYECYGVVTHFATITDDSFVWSIESETELLHVSRFDFTEASKKGTHLCVKEAVADLRRGLVFDHYCLSREALAGADNMVLKKYRGLRSNFDMQRADDDFKNNDIDCTRVY